MVDIWFIAFIISYASTLILAYVAYISKIVKRLRHGRRFLSWHILDTGEHGDHIFEDGVNQVGGWSRVFVDGCDFNGTVFYQQRNAEPLKIKEATPPLNIHQDLKSYKYYCDTKNFDTNYRNNVLETLFILNAKNIILVLIAIGIVVTVLGVAVNYLVINNAHTDITAAITALHNTTNAGVVVGGGS